jgi:hypothetical protein
VLWVWLGVVVHDGIEVLADPGERVSVAADDLAGSLADAGGTLEGTPLVGDQVSAPFGSASDAASALGDAGASGSEAVRRLAFWAGVLVALVPIGYVARRYVPARVGFVRDASAADAVLTGDADLEVFAWRAVTTLPLSRVVRVSRDPVGAIHRGDTDVVRRLAELELGRLGLAVKQPLADVSL